MKVIEDKHTTEVKEMKYLKGKILFLSLVILSFVVLIGCTSKSKYEALQNDYQALLTKYETLSVEYADLDNEYSKIQIESDKIQSESNKIQSEFNTLQSDYDSLENDNSLLKTENGELKVTIKDLESAVAVAQANSDDLKSDMADLEDNLYTVERELAELKDVYPAKLFASKSELRDWLLADDISERETDNPIEVYQNALELQERALRDGYIINAEIILSGTTTTYYTIYCTALTQENSLYWWMPSNDYVEYMIVDIEEIKWAVDR